ncbi:MAG: SpoIIE family protein phosphatase [Spirochaetia bacterium]|nr:SpoIIE family protein phosphatase [Spirochaetia bacterium]MDY3755257.1 SpoIIE family protein phosphatase [Treponema sp.]
MNDSFAYLPLLVATGAAFITIIILAANRERYHPVVITLHIICAILVGIVAVYTVINPLIFPIAVVLACSTILMLAAAVTNRVTRPREPKEKKVVQVQEVVETTSTENLEPVSGSVSLLEAGKNFTLIASEALAKEADLVPLLDSINASLIFETHAHGGAILLVDGFEDVLAVKSLAGDFPPPYRLPEDLPHKVIRVETNFRFSQFPLTETIFGAVACSGRGELITDPLSDIRIIQNGPEDFLKCGSYIFIPLKIKETVIGVVALARRYGEVAFTQREYDIASILADYASSAIKIVYSYQEVMEHAELTKEGDIACKLQATLPPKLLPTIPGLSLGSFQRIADGICGDYYDIIPARKDRISFVLADVAGKGMTSLMVMVMLRAMLRLTVNTTQSAATILSWANRGIASETTIDHFASVALINYDGEQKKIQIATAGATPVLLYHAATGEMEKISQMSDPVGVEKKTEYQDKDFAVETDDIIITYTDGVIEAPNSRGLQYSKERLLEVIVNNKHLSGKEIAEHVKTDILKFTGVDNQHDDQTLLIIKVQ